MLTLTVYQQNLILLENVCVSVSNTPVPGHVALPGLGLDRGSGRPGTRTLSGFSDALTSGIGPPEHTRIYHSFLVFTEPPAVSDLGGDLGGSEESGGKMQDFWL